MTEEIKQYLIDNIVQGTTRFKTLKATLIASFFTPTHYENTIYFMGKKMITFTSREDENQT